MPVKPTYPGVYIEEIPSGVRTITGVATSIAAFVGHFPKGLQNEAVTLSVARKLDLLQNIVKANPASVEVTSFVRAERDSSSSFTDDEGHQAPAVRRQLRRAMRKGIRSYKSSRAELLHPTANIHYHHSHAPA